ncbi:MAG TPA: Nif3-like dinuclear metal center hexameric protein [Gemmatimonadaceae bacterium]
MTQPTLGAIAADLDALLGTAAIPDYPAALNGVQLENRAPVRRVAAAVDFSTRVIDGALAAGANLLVVHHGMYWGGLRPLVGPAYERVRRLMEHDVAVYAAHLPLDAHPEIGNAALLARELGLERRDAFGQYKSIAVGARGESDVETAALLERARTFARGHGGDAIASRFAPGRRTRRWAIVTGSGATAETLREAAESGVDTLIVGEGPHWSAVDAEEMGLVVVYAGHYATETLGVQALARRLAERFGLPWSFVEAPTGL